LADAVVIEMDYSTEYEVSNDFNAIFSHICDARRDYTEEVSLYNMPY
jgi:hypothetical protein